MGLKMEYVYIIIMYCSETFRRFLKAPKPDCLCSCCLSRRYLLRLLVAIYLFVLLHVWHMRTTKGFSKQTAHKDIGRLYMANTDQFKSFLIEFKFVCVAQIPNALSNSGQFIALSLFCLYINRDSSLADA